MSPTRRPIGVRLLPGRPEALALTLLFVILPYLNSLDCSWHLDDISNILTNSAIHLKSISFQEIRETFFANPMEPGVLYRPVSCLSFALNWLWGQDDVLGYHIVNLAIHLVATAFLYFSILLILRSPLVNNRYKTGEYFIAAFATLLWASNPVHTQAITYIVQRMASLSAMFYIIGIWSYLKARSSQLLDKKSLWYFLLCLIVYFLAVGSKENAILFPFSLVLLELFFLRRSITTLKTIVIFFFVCCVLTTSVVFAFSEHNVLSLLSSYYTDRSFSLHQRLLTEGRIVLWYIGLLFFPSPYRLSIEHAFPLSTSFISPLTTILALTAIFSVIFTAFSLRRRYPILSFSVLFYLLNHVVESTVIPLELIFEHRNYLPSFFLFLPIAVLTHILLVKYIYQSVMYCLIVAFSTTLLLLAALGTIERNTAWKTDFSLWTDALTKAPENARPYINLAYHYQNQGLLQKSFQLCNQSLDKYSSTPWKDNLRAYNIMGNVMVRAGNFNKAIVFFDQAYLIAKSNKSIVYSTHALYSKAIAEWESGYKFKALNTMSDISRNNPDNGQYLLLYGEMLVAMEKLEDGIDVLGKALSVFTVNDSDYAIALLDLSLAFAKAGNTKKASYFLNTAQLFNTPPPLANLCLLENTIRAGEPIQAKRAFESLLSQLSWEELMTRLDGKTPEHLSFPISYQLLRQYAFTWLPTWSIK